MSDPAQGISGSDDASLRDLLPLVYEELRALAAHYLSAPGEQALTLQPTALVHEAYMKLGSADKRWSGRDHFMAVASTAMRQVLVDHARRRRTAKRGSDRPRADITIDGLSHDGTAAHAVVVLEMHDLLTQLAQLDARAARVAEMRLFGGMEQEQIARVLDISRMTVSTDWRFARAWLASRAGTEGGAA
jgi:RNA polymerase sigma-70 factor, ECF subfamily